MADIGQIDSLGAPQQLCDIKATREVVDVHFQSAGENASDDDSTHGIPSASNSQAR